MADLWGTDEAVIICDLVPFVGQIIMSTIPEIGMKRFQVDRREGNTIAVWSWFGWRLLVHFPLAVGVDYWVYVGWDHLSDFPFNVMPLLFAGLATYTLLVGVVNRISISVAPAAIQVKHYPLPIYRNVSLATDEVQSLYVKRGFISSGSGHSRSYQSIGWLLVARMKSGSDRTLLPKAVPREASLRFKDLINRELEVQRSQA